LKTRREVHRGVFKRDSDGAVDDELILLHLEAFQRRFDVTLKEAFDEPSNFVADSVVLTTGRNDISRIIPQIFKVDTRRGSLNTR